MKLLYIIREHCILFQKGAFNILKHSIGQDNDADIEYIIGTMCIDHCIQIKIPFKRNYVVDRFYLRTKDFNTNKHFKTLKFYFLLCIFAPLLGNIKKRRKTGNTASIDVITFKNMCTFL